MIRVTAREVLPYRITAAQAPHNAQRSWPKRQGVLLRLIDQSGRVGQGEAAPLPGLSPDDFASCEHALRGLRTGSLPEFSPATPLTVLADVGARFAHVPAARCAVEGALLDLAAQARGEPAWATLRAHLAGPCADSVPVAALLQAPDAPGRLAESERAIARGIRAVKVKVGRAGAFTRELDELATLRARLGGAVALRVDANRAWSAAEAEANLDALAGIQPEYVEEPTADWHGLARSATPLALDESLVHPDVLRAAIARRPALQLAVCVLKPTLLGGIVPVLELVALATEAGLACVLSHAFEGPVAFALSSALALATMAGTRAAGLAEHALLGAWGARPSWLHADAIHTWDTPGWGLPLVASPAFT